MARKLGEGKDAHLSSFSAYAAVWAALIVLLAATVGVTKFHVGPYGVLINLFISTAKAGLVLLFFMHLRYEGTFLKVMLAVALSAFTVIIILTYSDVWFRR